MSDPQEANTSEGKQEDGAGQHGGSDTSAAQSDSDDPEQVGSPIRRAGHNGHAPHIPAELSPSVVGNTALAIGPSPPAAPHGPVPVGDGAVTNATANDATIATTIANDVEAMGAEEQGTRDEAADDRDVGQTAAASEAVVSRGRETRLPVRHVYYFIQVFNTESQTLQTMGSFFSRLEENIKTALRKQLHWTEDKDFSIWKRTDRPVVTAMTSGETFEEIYVPDGACFIVRDKLNKERLVDVLLVNKPWLTLLDALNLRRLASLPDLTCSLTTSGPNHAIIRSKPSTASKPSRPLSRGTITAGISRTGTTTVEENTFPARPVRTKGISSSVGATVRE